MELKVKNSKKVWRSILAAMLTLCLGLGCINIPVSANTIENSAGATSKTTKSAEVKSVYDQKVTQDVIDTATPLTLDTSMEVTIETPGEIKWFSFTPSEKALYSFNTYDRTTGLTDIGALYMKEEYEDEYYNAYNAPLNINISTILKKNNVYYLCAGAQGDVTGSFMLRVKKLASATPESITVIKNESYSTVCSRMDTDAPYYGGTSFTIDYGTEEFYSMYISLYDTVSEDHYGNTYKLELKDKAQRTAWDEKKIGTYQLQLEVYDIKDTFLFSEDIEKKICSYEQTGEPAVRIEYGKEYPVSSWSQVYEFTAKETGNHLFYYSKKMECNGCLLKKGDETENILEIGTSNTWYANLTKGETYYLIVERQNKKTGNILFDYYNGSIDPAVATKPNATPKPQPQTLAAKPVVTASAGVPAQKVSVAKKKLSLQKGKSITLSTLVAPLNSTDKLTYKSSNTKVVKVSASGKITAKKPGKAKITITTSSGKSVTVTITVKKKAVATTKLSIKKKMTVKKGTVKFLPYKINASSTDKVTWKSSKKSVVTVDKNGKIVAKKKGKATITVKAGKKKATCIITVK